MVAGNVISTKEKRWSKMADKTSPSQESHVDSESDDEEVVETSPCGRWEKHRKEVCLSCVIILSRQSHLSLVEL